MSYLSVPAPLGLDTMVGNYLNIMKTTFGLNFDLYQAVKQRGYT